MTYFELFNLPESYQINKSALKTAYRQLAKLQHPDVLTDNASSSSSPEKILDLNEALKTLEQDDLRLAYLLKLGGLTPEEINDNKLDSAFLFDMMELSEQAESVSNNRSAQQVDGFLNTLSEQKKNVENQWCCTYTREKKSPATGRIQTHDLSIMRCVLHRCATTNASCLKNASLREALDSLSHLVLKS